MKNKEINPFSTPLKFELEERIRKCSEILEAFGNAKTVRNDNSSRFGKYIKIFIDLDNYSVIGAEIVTYLLEKSRVVDPNEFERNYHIFYELIYGAKKDLLDELFLKNDPSLYKILSTKINKLEGVDNVKLFDEIINAFGILNFSEVEIKQVLKIISAILLLGNVEFEQNKNPNEPLLINNTNNILDNICSLLNCQKDKLEKNLLNKIQFFKVDSRWIVSPLEMREALINKNIFIKELYDKLFKCIVNKLNESLENKKNQYHEGNLFYIGLLDIFGFECFDNNSLEQLFINYTNEKLQQIFIADVFKSDEKEFKDEGLESYLNKIKFSDNQSVIELMDNDNKTKFGIFQIIDDKCLMMASDDDSLYCDIIKKFEKNELFKFSKIKKNYFKIIHTAKTVEYNTNGFILKNRDKIEISLLEIMQSTYLINWNMMENLEKDKDKFLGLKFRIDITKLIKELKSCKRHYIRCLKPNEPRLKNVLIPCYVFNQIRYLGILDSIRIRKENFPKRINYKDFFIKNRHFIENYSPKPISKHNFLLKSIKDTKELEKNDVYFIDGSLAILDEFFSDRTISSCLLGRSKIYMMQDLNNRIESELLRIIEKKTLLVNKIKHAFKSYQLAKNVFFTKITIIRIFLRRINHQKKYKELCKKRIRNTLKIAYFSKVILEIKMNSILRKIQYFLFFKKTRAFIKRKFSYCIAKDNCEMIFNKVEKTIKKKNYDNLIIELIKNYVKFKRREKALKTINAIRRLKYTIILNIFRKKLKAKNLAQKIIARNWLRIYIKNKVINKRINDFLSDDNKDIEMISFSMDVILFPHLANKKLEEANDYSYEDNNFNFTNINSAKKKEATNENKYTKYKPTIPFFDYYGEPKIVLFAKILNVDVVVKLF